MPVLKALVGAVVLTVRVEGVPALTELGLNKQVGASAGAGCTEQEKATEPLNPPYSVTVNVEVAEPPAFTVVGVSPVVETLKPGTLPHFVVESWCSVLPHTRGAPNVADCPVLHPVNDPGQEKAVCERHNPVSTPLNISQYDAVPNRGTS